MSEPINTGMLEASGALGNHRTSEGIPGGNSGGKVIFFEGADLGSVISTPPLNPLTTEGMDSIFAFTKSGALSQSITEQLDNTITQQVAVQPNGQPGLDLQTLGKNEISQAPPTTQGDFQFSKVGFFGQSASAA